MSIQRFKTSSHISSVGSVGQICHFQISQNQHTWINLVSLSRAGRGFQDEEVETEVLQAWATFATGGEVIVQSFQASAPAPVTTLDSQFPLHMWIIVQDSWPQFNPTNSSVMLLGSGDDEVQLISYPPLLVVTSKMVIGMMMCKDNADADAHQNPVDLLCLS